MKVTEAKAAYETALREFEIAHARWINTSADDCDYRMWEAIKDRKLESYQNAKAVYDKLVQS